MNSEKTVQWNIGMNRNFNVRTRGVRFFGRGVKQHHSEETNAAGWNIYKMTRAAFGRLVEKHPLATYGY